MLKHCKHPDDLYSNGESHLYLNIVEMDCVLSQSGPIDMNTDVNPWREVPMLL